MELSIEVAELLILCFSDISTGNIDEKIRLRGVFDGSVRLAQ